MGQGRVFGSPLLPCRGTAHNWMQISLAANRSPQNLHRRHLTTEQRSMVAGRLETMKQGRPGKDANLHVSKVTRADAAEQMQVSPRSVAHARKVIDSGHEEIIASVDAGETAVSKAAEIVNSPNTSELWAAERMRQQSRHAAHTGNNEWYTPAEYVELARDVLKGIELDPATCEVSQDRARLRRLRRRRSRCFRHEYQLAPSPLDDAPAIDGGGEIGKPEGWVKPTRGSAKLHWLNQPSRSGRPAAS